MFLLVGFFIIDLKAVSQKAHQHQAFFLIQRGKPVRTLSLQTLVICIILCAAF